jgi:hypothetical protein
LNETPKTKNAKGITLEKGQKMEKIPNSQYYKHNDYEIHYDEEKGEYHVWLGNQLKAVKTNDELNRISEEQIFQRMTNDEVFALLIILKEQIENDN